MRNFFKNHFPRKHKVHVGSINKRQYLESTKVPDVLDTDEDRVNKEYDKYRKLLTNESFKLQAASFKP